MALEQINFWVALGTLILQILTIAFLALFFLRDKFPDLAAISDFAGRRGLLLGFLLTQGAILGSLYYSEVLGIAPCGLCWLQRIFLFPQAILFALAIWKKDRGVADYSIALSIFGGAVALYQHYLQMGGADVLPCPAVANEAADCAVRFLYELGYITFPLVSFTVFASLIILMMFVRKGNL